MDDIDYLVDNQLEAMELALKARKGAARELEPKGFCHYGGCEDDVEEGHLFCNASCRDAWQHEQDRRRMNGR
ncbi:hypothetical protein [Burkholderia phage BCSR5]|nr:hypothetical protein [Burkholderia phage BCSR5]